MDVRITSPEILANCVLKMGFLPFFQNEIQGFSIEEHTPRQFWFSDTQDGPWEWKGIVARSKTCVYGKFFQKKAGFVSLEWLPDFANYRRDGYDFDARCDDGLVFYKDEYLYQAVLENEPVLTPVLKEVCNYRKGGNKGFETVITRLQMQTYVTIADFEYKKDRNGNQYGWGVARYATPESLLGAATVRSAYTRSPEESKERILRHLKDLFPKEDEKRLLKMLG